MEPKEPDQDKIIEAVKKYYGLKIDANAYQYADVYAYEETTTDGYSLFVVTHDMKEVCISEDVYYYDHGVAERIMEMVGYCNDECVLYADDYFLEDICFDDQLLEEFQDVADKIYDNIVNDEDDYDFDEAELQWLKEEFTESEEINQTVS
jgi:hypothetical protein